MEEKMRIWWIPNPPKNKPFTKEVETTKQAKEILTLLADYDLYLGDDLISSNAGGLEITEDGKWLGTEWYNREGEDIWTEEKDIGKRYTNTNIRGRDRNRIREFEVRK